MVCFNLSRWTSLFGMMGLMLLCGCGRGTADGYQGQRGTVSGTVTLDGKPIAKGSQVIFIGKEKGYTASGVVDDQGKYTLVYKEKSGLPVGEYLVQLSAPAAAAAKPGETVDPMAKAAQLKLTKKGSADKPAEGPFPSKYLATNTSNLTFKVEAKPNTADFKLEK